MHLVLVLVACCWRASPPPPAPKPSFVARVSALGELRRSTPALARRMELTMQRILGLASEAIVASASGIETLDRRARRAS